MVKPLKKSKNIPLPPGSEASWEEQAAYYEQYDLEDIQATTGTQNLTDADLQEMEAVSALATDRIAKRKREQFNISLQPDELVRFAALAERLHIPPTTLARAWILQRLDQELSNAS